MLYEYKVQKVADGKVTFDVYASKLAEQKWYKKKKWQMLDNYGQRTSYPTLGEAQSVISQELENDKTTEYNNNKRKKTVLKEYTYTDVPNYIPKEQQENFCDLKGVKI